MGKIKSAICLTLITLVIAVLCLICFVPFPVGSDGIHYFNPIINWAETSSDLGSYQYGENAEYNGGSFSIMLYPEGVISAKDYESNCEMLEEEDRAEYEEKYVSNANGSLWLEKEVVFDGDNVSDEFKESFKKRVDILKARFERLHSEGLLLQIVDEYSVRVTLPAGVDASLASFIYYAYMGNLEVSFGTSLTSATKVFPEAGRKVKPISEYMKGAGVRTINGTIYVALHFTKLGQELVANATSNAESSTGTLFFTVGGDQVIGLSVSSQINEKDLYISGSYTEDAAKIISTVIDTAIEFDSDIELGHMELGELYQNQAGFGKNALMFLYIALGASLLAAAIAFLVRYHRLGFATIYSLVIFVLAMLLVVWAIPALSIGMGTVTAFVITAVALCVSNAIAYENARKEYALGKTMASSVKNGYKKCFWQLLEMHLAIAVIGVIIFLIGLSELSAFGLVLTLGGLFSGIASLAINRFMWYIMMPFSKNQGKFCHFKREEVDDE